MSVCVPFFGKLLFFFAILNIGKLFDVFFYPYFWKFYPLADKNFWDTDTNGVFKRQKNKNRLFGKRQKSEKLFL